MDIVYKLYRSNRLRWAVTELMRHRIDCYDSLRNCILGFESDVIKMMESAYNDSNIHLIRSSQPYQACRKDLVARKHYVQI